MRRAGDRFDAHSAGNEATDVRPLAIQAMNEIGIDISRQRSKSTATYEGQTFDRVITVFSDAVEACPYFPGAKARDHWDLDDPVAATGTGQDERLDAFRRVRDEIADHVRGLIDARPTITLEEGGPG